MTEKAKLFLEENTPTLLDKINAYNNIKPKKKLKKNYKSFSEHNFPTSYSKITISPARKHENIENSINDRINSQMYTPNNFFTSETEKDKEKESFFTNKTLGNKKLTPEIIKKNRDFLKGLGISDYHSASTFQNSIPAISFSKAPRFFSKENNIKQINPIKTPKDIYSILLPSITTTQRSTKGVSFGFSQRVLQPSHLFKKDLENPAPNRYNVREVLIKPNNAKSFGMPYKVYSKVFIKHMLQPEIDIPGPGSYNKVERTSKKSLVKNIWGKDSSRENSIEKNNVKTKLPPNYYSPKTNFEQSGRYRSVSFGKAKRII